MTISNHKYDEIFTYYVEKLGGPIFEKTMLPKKTQQIAHFLFFHWRVLRYIYYTKYDKINIFTQNVSIENIQFIVTLKNHFDTFCIHTNDPRNFQHAKKIRWTKPQTYKPCRHVFRIQSALFFGLNIIFIGRSIDSWNIFVEQTKDNYFWRNRTWSATTTKTLCACVAV